MFYLFILERAHACEHRGGAERERERERETIPSKLHAVSVEPDARLDLLNCEIVT